MMPIVGVPAGVTMVGELVMMMNGIATITGAAIHPTVYYKWLKDFMEAGKARMRGDALREANSDEVQELRQENERLKQLVADLSVANMVLKKSQYSG
jgi:transposase-like protein